MPGLIVRPRSGVLRGHDWVFRNEVQKAYGNPPDGSVVILKDGKDRTLGSAIYNSRSTIVARRFSHGRDQLDDALLERRLDRALAYRQSLGLNRTACRLFWSESDGLPGLVVDRYGPLVVLQALTLGMDACKERIAHLLLRDATLTGVYERSDTPGRKTEGLEAASGWLAGTPCETDVEIRIGQLRFRVDPLAGQKTGFYLDQCENYAAVGTRARGRRVLDCFSNQGGFALAMASAGAQEVLAIDASTAALERLRTNASANHLEVQVQEADVFDWLASAARRNEKFGLVVLDPPSFARGRGRLQDALRGYRELHRQAAALLEPGGFLATFSCSHHVGDAAFLDAVRAGFHDARRSARVTETYRQAADHPVLLSMPETAYLNGFLLQAL